MPMQSSKRSLVHLARLEVAVMWAVVVLGLLHLVCGKKWKEILPPGYEIVDGEAIDVTNKVIQVAGTSGTLYFAFEDPGGKPIYVRDAYENGWHFIVFDDPYNQDPGGGHLIVLQRMTGVSLDGSGKIVYEAFLLSLEESVSADVEPYDPMEFDYYKDEDHTNVEHDAAQISKSVI